MRRARAILAAAFSLCLLSCSKSRTTQHNPLVGQWQLLQQQSGIMPTINYPLGNTNSLVFKNTTYQIVADGRVVQSGTYRLTHDASVANEVCLVVPAGEFEERLIYDNDHSRKIYVHVSAGKLELLSGCFAADAGTYQTYVKQSAAD